MCCHDDAALDLPPAVIEMVARYRRMRAEQGVGWGEEAFPDMFRWARFARLGPAFDVFAASGDWAGAVRAAVGADVPAGLALVTVGADGGLTARTGPARPVVPGTTVQIDVVLDSRPTATSSSPSTVRRCRCRPTERGCGRSTRPARSS